jgi:hypothetical protein
MDGCAEAGDRRRDRRAEWLSLEGCAALQPSSAAIGTLVVHSLSLRGGDLEDAIVWDITTVRAVRAALEEAMLTKGGSSHATAIRRKGVDRDER